MAVTKRVRTIKSAKAASKGGNSAAISAVREQPAHLHDVIRTRAYELFEQRGSQHGHDFDDWLHAEAEVLMRYGERTA
jgi:hypothetical protein